MADATKPRAPRQPRGGAKSAKNQSSRATRQSQSTAEATGTSATIGNYFNDEVADCINCKQTFTSDSEPMISCSRCAKWQCQLCAGISSETYAFLSNREDFAWYCPPCKLPAAEDVLNGIQIEEKCQKFLTPLAPD